jgi:CDP-6-deoxy-D-xylo-4-hexulose-3-dehydrase
MPLASRVILPEATANSKPSWFGFLLTVKEQAGFRREEIVEYLEANGIQTRMLFAGNMIKHPCFDEMRRTKKGYRVIGNLKNTNLIMNNSFWVGVYPGLTDKMSSFIIDQIKNFTKKRS